MKSILDKGSTPFTSTISNLVYQNIAGNAAETAYDGGVLGFDRVMSKELDNTVGDDRKSSKTINANDNVFALAA
jgi:hypothetical protein